jgi:hypothetical protein
MYFNFKIMEMRKMTDSKKSWPLLTPSIFFIAAILIIFYLVLNPGLGVSIDILIVLLTATLSAYGWIIKNEFDKRRELDRLTFETRRQSYERLLQPFIDVFSAIGGGGQVNQANLGSQMQEAGIKLHMYGSDDVIRAFNRFRAIAVDIENVKVQIENAQQGRGNQQALQELQGRLQSLNFRMIVGWANLIITIRKSTGFPDSTLSIEEYLRAFIKDYNAHAAQIQQEIENFKQNQG